MPIIPIEMAKIGMKVDKDIYSAAGAKLIPRGAVLTERHIVTLMKNNIQKLDVDTAPVMVDENGDPVVPESERPEPRNEREARIHLLSKIPMFEPFSETQLGLLMSSFKVETHEARTTLFKQHDPGDSFFIILKGSIKIYIKTGRGSERILSVCNAGESFGELSLLDGRPRSASAQTLQKTELLVITRDRFLGLLESNFEITHTVMKDIIKRIYDTHQHNQDAISVDAQTRVIKSLIRLARRFGKRSDHAIDVDLPLDLGELGQMVGMTLEELHAVLYQLEKKDLVRVHANYYALNLSKLRTMR